MLCFHLSVSKSHTVASSIQRTTSVMSLIDPSPKRSMISLTGIVSVHVRMSAKMRLFSLSFSISSVMHTASRM